MKRKIVAFAGAITLGVALASPPAAQNRVASAQTEAGELVYKKHCAACHQADGGGYAGLYPALAKNPRLVEPAYPLMVIINGQNAMPAIGRNLKDQQVADVVNYLRSNLGNRYKPTVKPADAAALRP